MERSILFPSNPSRGGSKSVQMFLGQNGQRRPFTIIIRGWAQPSGTGAQRSGGQTGSTSGPIRRNSCRTKFGGKNIAGIWPKIKKYISKLREHLQIFWYAKHDSLFIFKLSN